MQQNRGISMPAISQIRFTNVVYEDGQKRYNDDLFKFDGYNGAIVLENGGGKTVLIQTLLQAVIPHTDLGERKIRDTLKLEGPAHIAIEWIISERPRRYVVTSVSLFMSDNKVDSLKYVYEYSANDADCIELMPFVKEDGKRPAERFEIADYYKTKAQQTPLAGTFDTIKAYRSFLEEKYHIISDEWDSIVKINQDEGGIERFFDNCKTEKHLYDRLLIPTVESSIAGFDHDRFANTFEEQQKSFKLYKELRAQIAEYESIEKELSSYVLANEVLYLKEQQYKESKADAKGIYLLAKAQKEKTESEIRLVEQALEKLEVGQMNLEAKHDSYQIRMKEAEFITQQEKLALFEEERDRVRETVHHLKKNYFSMTLAKQQMIERVQTELVEHYTMEIALLDAQSDATEFADELQTVHRELSGYFIEQQEKLEKEISGLEQELRPIEDALLLCEQESKEHQEDNMSLEKDKTEKEVLIQSLEKSMQQIRQQILSNSEQETVENRLPEWIKEQTQVDESIVALQNDNRSAKQLRLEAKEKSSTLQNEITADLIKLTRSEVEVQRMQDAHTAQKEQLGQLSFSLSRIESLYMKQSSAEADILRTIERMKEQKEEKYLSERLAYRFLDDYATQDIFFADPFMEQQIQRWSNSIGLIETGIRYLNGLDVSVEEQIQKFAYWPVTLITTTDKKANLLEKVERVQENLIYPIHVIDLQEAKVLLEGNQTTGISAVLPLHWKENMNSASFTTWKESLQAEANRITEERQELEEKLTVWEEARRSLHHFFKHFPYDALKEAIETERLLKDGLHLKKRLLQRSDKKVEELEAKIESNDRKIVALKDELNGLDHRIVAGQKHEAEAKEIIHLKEEAEGIRLNLKELHRDINKLTHRQKSYEVEKKESNDQIASVKTHIDWLRRDDYYKVVKDLTPIFTNHTLDLLKERVETITRALNKISSSRRELETKLKNARDRLLDANDEIDRIQADWKDFDVISFPENGDMEIDRLRQREKDELKILDEKIHVFEEQKTNVAIIHAKLDELRERFKKSHLDEEIYTFSEPLHIIHNMLETETIQLHEQRKQYNIGLERFNKELQKGVQAIVELEKYLEAHHFNAVSIVEKQLAESDENEFAYEPMRIVRRVTTAMREVSEAVKMETEKVFESRQDFRAYVRQNMSDAKMRDNLFQGLEYKRGYEEIVAFQQNIRTKMNSIIRINEESIRGHDEQLDHFVTYMHEHVRTVVRELGIIPTKTRINFSAGTKQIYNFKVSEWEEKDGLMRLRAYIDEVLDWIEHPRYIDPDGKVNSGKIRSDIEKWFETPQLLRIVLQNGDMKVSCRKVTNDNEATSRSFSWRESNEWSGGEKWSKNMTLFLGILNYVAEKKKLLDTSMKRNRAVVLDNPFGKASSEHVLSPVFFIAEKLGFQIIALTAHAEGKFLRDYFPVIYSCRLRSAQNTDKMIMTKEKTVNTAFFQDNDPVAFDRIGESEQLSLLD